MGNFGASLKCCEGNYLAQLPVGGHLGLLLGSEVHLSLFYLAKPQSSFDYTGSP